MGSGRTTASGALTLAAPSARLGAGRRYALVLRTAKGALVTTAVGATR